LITNQGAAEMNAQTEQQIAADTEAFLQRILALPKTHAVVATYECGKVYRYEAHSLKSAENHAIGWHRKVGRDLIDRMTGRTVKVVSVEVAAL
jgi:S-ribosylhomocysteine lyase LuxS involved in autoinducer biosynthesis